MTGLFTVNNSAINTNQPSYLFTVNKPRPDIHDPGGLFTVNNPPLQRGTPL